MGETKPEAMPLMMPVFDVAAAVQRRDALQQYVNHFLIEGNDYGTIPGTGRKGPRGEELPNLTLLKPGAEKLTTFFGLTVSFAAVEVVEDWNGMDHFDPNNNPEPFFYYWYRCSLHKGDWKVCDADGSANSREKKYRWRSLDRKCPNCGQESILKSKDRPEWFCWVKKGGCGRTFRYDDEDITTQVTGQKPNPDIYDTVNTLQKMAQKRALVAAVLIGVNASDFFTQDMDDQVERSVSVDTGEIQYTQKAEPTAASRAASRSSDTPRPSPPANTKSAQNTAADTSEPSRVGSADNSRPSPPANTKSAQNTAADATESRRVENVNLVKSRIKKLGETYPSQAAVFKTWCEVNTNTFDCPLEEMNVDQIKMINDKIGALVAEGRAAQKKAEDHAATINAAKALVAS